ncbi:MAG: hypothetical protein ACXQTI_08885 [Candidatus Nezhaarchaeales archaeon]
MVNLIEHLREHGYYDIKVVEIRRSYLKLIVDGNIVEVKLKKNTVLVKAYRVNPHLAKVVWEAFAVP